MREQLNKLLKSIPDELKYDKLTLVYTKSVINSYCELLIENNIPFALYFIDFDNFKKVNDTLGHQKGDKALFDCANTLKNSLDNSSSIFRFGGDEFIIVSENINTRDEEWTIARNFTQAIRNKNYPYLENVFTDGRMTITTGASRFPYDSKSLDELISLADKALYRGKNKGKNCFIIYDKILHKDINIASQNSTLTIEGLINFIFDKMKQYDKNNPLITLQYIFNVLGLYYQDTFISLINDTDNILIYKDEKENESIYHSISMKSLHLKDNDKKAILYYYDILNENKHRELLTMMKKSHIRSLLAYKVVGLEKENAVLLIHARRDKIFSEHQLYLYQTIAELFSLLNIRD